MRLSAALLLGAMACGHAPGKEAVATKPEAPVRFVGTITDLDFGCWADRTCAVRVDDVWVALPGGPQAAQAPHGQLVGIAISGEPGDVLKAKVVGKRAEVFAAPAVAFDAAGKPGYDPQHFTLVGSNDYYVRLVTK